MVVLRYRSQSNRLNKTDEYDSAHAQSEVLISQVKTGYLVLKTVGVDLKTVI